MSNDIVKRARELVGAATDVPWRVELLARMPHRIEIWTDTNFEDCRVFTEHDAALITAAPELLSKLADECEWLRKSDERIASLTSTIANLGEIIDGLRAENKKLRNLYSEDAELYRSRGFREGREAALAENDDPRDRYELALDEIAHNDCGCAPIARAALAAKEPGK